MNKKKRPTDSSEATIYHYISLSRRTKKKRIKKKQIKNLTLAILAHNG